MLAKAGITQHLTGSQAGMSILAETSGGITVRYTGNSVPREAVEADLVSQVNPDLLKGLNAIRVPIVLEDRIKVDEKFYHVGDSIEVEGTTLRLLKFSEDRVYLKEDASGIIYKVLINFRGEVTSIKPLSGKQG